MQDFWDRFQSPYRIKINRIKYQRILIFEFQLYWLSSKDYWNYNDKRKLYLANLPLAK